MVLTVLGRGKNPEEAWLNAAMIPFCLNPLKSDVSIPFLQLARGFDFFCPCLA